MGRASTPVAQSAAAKRRAPLAAAQVRQKTASRNRALRLAIQIVFFVFAPGLFSGAFNGIKYIFTQIGLTSGIEAASFVVLLVALLAFTVLFGRFFCGYACAFGTLGDIVYGVFDLLRAKLALPRLVIPDPVVRVLSLLKFAVLAGVCIACVTGAWSAVSGYSPWVAFASLTSLSLDGVQTVAIVLLCLIVVGMAVRERFFCQFLCPLGAIFSLMPVFGFSEFTRIKGHCAANCGRCKEACPVSVWPDADHIAHGECIGCGRCADACPMCNVNFAAIERELASAADDVQVAPKRRGPLLKTREKWRLVRGTEVPLVLGKACVLFVVCWAIGAVRYLPSLGLW